LPRNAHLNKLCEEIEFTVVYGIPHELFDENEARRKALDSSASVVHWLRGKLPVMQWYLYNVGMPQLPGKRNAEEGKPFALWNMLETRNMELLMTYLRLDISRRK
jgi:hypothetical protein